MTTKAVIYGDFRDDRGTIDAMEQELNDMLSTAGNLREMGDNSINSTQFWYDAAEALIRGAKDLGPRIRHLREEVESRGRGENADRRSIVMKGAHGVYR